MAYNLSSFSPEFTFAEGEPYDRGTPELSSKKKPISLWSAILYCQQNDAENWKRIAEELAIEVSYLTPEAVLDKIQEVDTCSNLTEPVSVWVDDDGWITLEVYNPDRHE